jgi:hypothetical protein
MFEDLRFDSISTAIRGLTFHNSRFESSHQRSCCNRT